MVNIDYSQTLWSYLVILWFKYGNGELPANISAWRNNMSLYDWVGVSLLAWGEGSELKESRGQKGWWQQVSDANLNGEES